MAKDTGGVLPNAKHEVACQLRASGKTPEEAYAGAGYARDQGNARKFFLKPDIRRRVTELQQQSAAVVGISREFVVKNLVLNAEIAMGTVPVKIIRLKKKPRGEAADPEAAPETETIEITQRDAGAANRALELLGKEVGMFVERQETENHHYNISDEPMTEEEWEESFASDGIETPFKH
jgi:hypothetical protein